MSARKLNATLHTVFPESAIFRIDHFLGKEAVEDLYFFRFANTFSNRYGIAITSIMCRSPWPKLSELRGVDESMTRAAAIRDVIQNHLLQVVALLAMEPPTELTPRALHDEQFKVFRATDPLNPGIRFEVSSRDTAMKTVLLPVRRLRPTRRFAYTLIPGAGQECLS